MEDVPWLYVAMIFIAFVSWIWGQIQEAATARRERIAEKKRAAEARRTTEVTEWESPYRGQRSTPPAPEVAEEESPKTFREVFREIERQMSEVEPADSQEAPQPTAPSPAAPPPLPPSPSQDSGQARAPERQRAVLPQSSPIVAGAIGKSSRKKAAHKHEATGELAGVLRNPKSLRTALILKEVLDRPRAMRRSIR